MPHKSETINKEELVVKKKRTMNLVPYLYVAPTVALTVLFVLYPFFANFSYSFLRWDGFGERTFIGLKNFLTMLFDERFWSAFWTNLLYFLFIVVLPIALGLVFASIIARGRLRGTRFLQSAYFIPQVVAAIALGTIFRWIYAPLFGVLYQVCKVTGLERLARPWLGSATTAPIAIGLIGTWAWLGFCIIIFVAGIQKIDPYLYEASLLDGAGPVQQFFFITLPELRFEIRVVLIMTTVQCLGSFAFAVVSTTTGGAYGTRPIALYAYQLAFVEGKVGYASAVVSVLTVLTLSIAALAILLGEGRSTE